MISSHTHEDVITWTSSMVLLAHLHVTRPPLAQDFSFMNIQLCIAFSQIKAVTHSPHKGASLKIQDTQSRCMFPYKKIDA